MNIDVNTKASIYNAIYLPEKFLKFLSLNYLLIKMLYFVIIAVIIFKHGIYTIL